MCSTFALLSLALQSPQQVSFSNVRFTSEDNVQTAIAASGQVPGGVPGELLADFSFQSPLFDPATGRYYAPRIATLWKISRADGSAISTEPEGAWMGLAQPRPELLVTTFDDVTGVGTAELAVPIGKLVAPGVRYPHLPDFNATLSLALGLRSTLTEDSTGLPIHVSWQGSLSLQVSWPDVWLAQVSPVTEIHDSVLCLLVLRAPSASARNFVIQATVPTLVDVPLQPVVVPAGAHYVEFTATAKEPGRYRLQALESGHDVVTSNRCLIVSDSFEAAVGSGGQGQAPLGPPVENQIFRHCEPAKGDTGITAFTTCGPCVPMTQPATHSCPEFATRFMGALCSPALFEVCTPTTATVQSLVYRLAETTTPTCAIVEGSTNNPFYNVTVSKQYHNQCCRYVATNADPVDLNVNSCVE